MKNRITTITVIIGALTWAWMGCLQSAHAYIDHRTVKTDSLEAMLNSPHPPKGEDLLRVYLDLSLGYRDWDGKRSLDYAERALTLTYRMNALNARESALYNIGLLAYSGDDYDRAVHYMNWALAVTDSMRGDPRYTEDAIDDNLSQLYGALGNIYNIQDKHYLAIAYYQKALPIFERHGWLQSQTILYHNVGELYLSMGNDIEAERNYLKAIETANQSQDSLMMALARKGLVKIYIGRNDYARAKRTADEAYAYYHPHRDEEPGDYPEVLASMTRLNLMDGHCDVAKAKAYIEEALEYVNDDMVTEDVFNLYAARCEVAMAEGKWQEALKYGLQSVHPNDEDATYHDAGCYKLLADIYTELGDKAKAKECTTKMHEIMQRYATEHYQSGISQMEVLYETEKKEATIAQLTKEKRWLTIGGILAVVVFLLVAVAFFLFWWSSRLKKRHDVVKARLEGELAERVRIARDLHDRLGGVLTALRQNISTVPQQETALSLVDNAIAEMRNVSHHLLPESLSRYGLRTALRDYCQTMKNVTFSFVGEERRIQHEETIYCIVYELVNNAVKSSGAQHIKVQLLEDKDYTAINVSDDGKGMPLDVEGNGKGIVPDVEGDGTGLRNIRERITAIGGTLDLYTKPDVGTEINIEIKK